MRASGVYWTLTDESIKVAGSTALLGVVFMLTTKGKMNELIRVTSSDFEEKLGYDLAYNPNYFGLKKMLEKVSYLDVVRLNYKAACANLYEKDGAILNYDNLEQDVSLEEVASTFAVSMKDVGNDARHFVKVSPAASLSPFTVETISGSPDKYEATLANKIGLSVAFLQHGTNLYAAIIYDSDKETPLALVKTDGKIVKLDGTEEIGEATESKLTFKAADSITASGTSFFIKAYDAEKKEYKLTHATSPDGSVFKPRDVVYFSLVSDAKNHWSKVDFGELNVWIGADPKFSLLLTYKELLKGSNGSMVPATKINLNCLRTSPANVIVLQGISDIALINSIAEYGAKLLKTTLVGAPPLTTYSAVNDWASTLFPSEYVQLYWISDINNDPDIGDFFVSPSVQAFSVLADMIAKTGTLCFPQAGPTYGTVSVTKLQKTDFELYKDELKTNKINYLMVGNAGTMIWEQRTRYALESDLTYANSVFILRQLRQDILGFAEQFNFRYSSASMLTVFGSGIKSILDDMSDKGFVAKYSLDVPSFEEAQKMGRTLKIKIGIAIAQDAEEIVFNVVLQNYADVA